MSCDDCDKAHDQAPAFYYRIQNGNVQVKGCERHVKIMFERLRSYGVRKEEASNFQAWHYPSADP